MNADVLFLRSVTKLVYAMQYLECGGLLIKNTGDVVSQSGGSLHQKALFLAIMSRHFKVMSGSQGNTTGPYDVCILLSVSL